MNLRRLRFTSREGAEDATPDLCSAVISIRDPGSKPVDLKRGWYKVLSLVFHDIDRDKLSTMSAHLRADIELAYAMMEPAHAQVIVAFVNDAVRAGVEGFLVHCEAGISRSAAVAKWIAEHYHLPSLRPAVVAHNRYVYRLLKEAACTE